MNLLRRTGKIFLYLILALVVLSLALVVAIRIPSVQTWATGKVAAMLSESLQAKIAVGGVKINFFKTAVLEDIYVEDRQGDTLLFAQVLKADIGIFNLLGNEIYLNHASLEGAYVDLHRRSADSIFNYQFIVDAFATDAPKDTTAKPWTFGIGGLSLQDVRFNMKDEGSGRFDLLARVGKWNVGVDDLDLAHFKIALGKIALSHSDVSFRLLPKDATLVPPAAPDSAKLQFPGFGWTITADKFRLENNRLAFNDENAPRLEKALDYGHLDLQNLLLSVDDFRYADDGISLKLNKAAFQDANGFVLEDLHGEVKVLPDGIEVDGFFLSTPQSSFENNTRLAFSEFNDLTDFVNRVSLESEFTDSHLAISDLLMIAPSLREVPNLRWPENGVLHLQGRLGLANDSLFLANLIFSMDENTQLQASGSIAQLTTDPFYNVAIDKLTTSYRSLDHYTTGLGLPPALKNFGQFSINGRIKGRLAKLEATGLNLTTQSATRFSGDLRADGLPDFNTTVFDLKIKQLVTRAEDLKGFVKDTLPPQLDSLGLVQFAGNFKGTIHDFDINGQFQTTPGNLDTDLSMAFNQDYSFASYEGKLAMENFNLGSLLGDTLDIGAVSLRLDLNGAGLALDSINTNLKGSISRAVFRKYEYQNIQVDGQLINGAFDGKLMVADKNLNLDLAGKFNLLDSVPALDLTVKMDTVNLKNLNLSGTELAFSGQLVADIYGNNPDNLKGLATLSDFTLSGSGGKYRDKKILLEARQLGDGSRALLFNAGFMSARVEGKYKFEDLPNLIFGFVNHYYPVEELLLSEEARLHARPEVADQQFGFDFQFTDLTTVANVFVPGFLAVDSSSFLQGKFNSAEKSLAMNAVFSNLQYQGIRLDSLLLSADGDNRRIQTNLSARNLNLGNSFFATKMDFDSRLGDDSLRFNLAILDDTSGVELKLGGKAEEVAEENRLVFDRQLILNENEWHFDEKNMIRFVKNKLYINDLTIGRGGQSISINSRGEAPANDYSPIELAFDNFKLSEISDILNNPGMRLAGGLNGKFTVIEPKTNLHYNANVTVDTLSLNEQLLGTLRLEAAQPAGQRVIDILTELSGENKMKVQGTYALDDNRFDITANLEKLGTVVADPFLNTLIRDSKGYLSGILTIKGTPDKPTMRGSITTHDVSTEVVMTGTRYRTGKNTITLSEHEIDVGQQVVFDARDQKATLSGKISHDYFKNMKLDLRAQTDGLQMLNTTRENNRLYYGKIFASADVQIQGTPELPVLKVTATTQDSTLLHVEPLTSDLAVVQEDYIIFANPNSYQPDSLQALEQQIGRKAAGFDLTLTLLVTPKAELNIIIDPLTGDQLFCNGSGNFTVRMNPAGDLTIVGTYIIEKGNYSFSYQGLVKKDFEIRKGSSLSFSGDPYDARFDITAVYKTRATTYELISTQATDPATLDAARRRTDVEVLMNIDGNLNAPAITFDINLPNSQGGLVDNLTTRRLADLKDDPTEQNKQVFGLLLFNSFIASQTGGGLSNVGQNVALGSVSSLITGQLNKLADRFIKGVDVTVGVDSYQSGSGVASSNVTEVQLGLSKRLFNDRLTIRVGGNFNLENSQSSSLQEGGYSAIAGDFVLEYKLTEKGNYLLKVFHESDYNILLDANTTKSGVGVVFRKSY
ncbi:MAG: translocation/assembly module TamB domain-containing protein [Saprospiraceae bacterium]